MAVIGLVGYAALLATAAFRGATAAALGIGCAVVGIAFGAYLLVAQIALIHAICQWCVASDAVVNLIAVAALWRYLLALRQSPHSSSAPSPMAIRTSRRETPAA